MDIINTLLAADVEINAQLSMERPSPSGNSGRFIHPQLNIGCRPLMRASISNPTTDVIMNESGVRNAGIRESYHLKPQLLSPCFSCGSSF
jgi:hypothetical protein